MSRLETLSVQQRETWLRRRLHRVKVITGGGRRRRWTAEAVDRMEIVSGPAVVRVGTEVVPRRCNGC
jgi:hypothetical protein